MTGLAGAASGTAAMSGEVLFTLFKHSPLAAVLVVVFGFAFYKFYETNLAVLTNLWWTDPSWSHGLAVPALSLFLVYIRWDDLAACPVRGTWAGLGILAVGVVGQVLFAATGTTHMQNLSMLVVLTGVTLWVLGWEFMRILWLPISYLVFSINPPGELYQRVTAPMQDWAAAIAAKLLILVNVWSEVQGNQLSVMWQGEYKPVNVAEACSGMRMLVAFFALAAVLAYSSARPMWQKVFLTCCAVPVAIVCNGLRVAIIAYLVASDPRPNSPWAHGDAHGFVGLAMLAPAMLMQVGIGWVLDRLFLEDPEATQGAAS
jgi:exosortase